MRADPAGQSLSAAADSRNAGHAYWQDNEISWFDWAKGGLRADLRVAGLQATFQGGADQTLRRRLGGTAAEVPEQWRRSSAGASATAGGLDIGHPVCERTADRMPINGGTRVGRRCCREAGARDRSLWSNRR